MGTTSHDEEYRREIEELLPWHAAGTLGRQDAARVEAALQEDPELARRFEMARDELAGTIGLNESLGAPSVRAMDRLFEKIAAEPARPFVPALDWRERLLGFFASLSPRTVAWSAAAAAFVIVLQSGLIGSALFEPRPAGSYTTASGPSRVATGGTFVLIRFEPNATSGQIAAFLEAEHLTIVDGPLGDGFYRVRVAQAVLSRSALAERVKRLEKIRVVDFVAAAG